MKYRRCKVAISEIRLNIVILSAGEYNQTDNNSMIIRIIDRCKMEVTAWTATLAVYDVSIYRVYLSCRLRTYSGMTYKPSDKN